MSETKAELKTKRTVVCLSPSEYETARNRAFDLRMTYSQYVSYLIKKDLEQAQNGKNNE